MKFTAIPSDKNTLTVTATYDYNDGDYTSNTWKIMNFNSGNMTYDLAELIFLFELKGKYMGFEKEDLPEEFLKLVSNYDEDLDEDTWKDIGDDLNWGYSDWGAAHTLEDIKLFGPEGEYSFSYSDDDIKEAIDFLKNY